MAFINCIQGKADAGLLTPKQALELQGKYDSLVKRYTNTMGNEQAAAQAAADLVKVEASVLAEKKRNQINGALAQTRIAGELDKLIKKTGIKYDEAVRDLLERSYARKQTVMKQYLTNLDEFVEEYRSKYAGIYRKSSGMRDIVSEMLGKNTGSAEAKKFSSALREVYDYAHARYKNAGGIIGKLDNYFPQVHKYQELKKVSFKEWYEYLRPRLDIDRMIDFETGLPFTEKKLLAQMKGDYEAIVTRGLSEIQKRAKDGKKTFGFGGELSQRKQSSRFYHFKDADSFLEYNERFGVGENGLFDATINHLESLARDTGILETLGPTPNSLMRFLDVQVTASGANVTSQKWIKGMYDALTGFVDSDAGEPWWFSVTANLRNLFSSAYLGSAPISAIADTAFIGATANLNKLSATQTLKRYLKMLNPLSSSDRQLARQSGYIADIARGSALADVRFTGENMGGPWTAWLAQFTNRASGLHAMTKAAADSISMEMEAALARKLDAKMSWKSIEKEFRDNLEVNGITEKHWEIFKKADLFEPEKGIKFLRSQEVAVAKGVDLIDAMDAANKLDDMISIMRNIATNEPTLRTRAITTGAAMGDARRGTFLRMIASSAAQFKSFPVTVIMNHVIPSLRDLKPILSGDFKGARYSHAAYTFVGATVFGALGLQVEQIIKGKDARDFEDWRFWMASALKGGGAGLFGDFLFQDYSRGGQNLAESLAGPTVGFASDFLRTFNGNLNRALDDDSGSFLEKFNRDTFNLVKRNIPANNLWYSRLALERLIFDQIERMVDPKFDKRQRMMQRRIMNDTGQGYYWRKGELTPDRAPRIADTR